MADNTQMHYKKVIQELESAEITHQNYEEYCNKAESTVSMMEAEIQRYTDNYTKHTKKLKNLAQKDSYKEQLATNKKVVPRDLFDELRGAQVAIKHINELNTLINAVLEPLYKKIKSSLGNAKALDIHKEVLKVEKERHEQQMELMNEIFGQKSARLNERIDNMKDWVIQRNEFQISAIKSLLSKKGFDDDEAQEILSEAPNKPAPVVDESVMDDIPDDLDTDFESEFEQEGFFDDDEEDESDKE